MFLDISSYGTKVRFSFTEKSNKKFSFLSTSTIDCLDATFFVSVSGNWCKGVEEVLHSLR